MAYSVNFIFSLFQGRQSEGYSKIQLNFHSKINSPGKEISVWFDINLVFFNSNLVKSQKEGM